MRRKATIGGQSITGKDFRIAERRYRPHDNQAALLIKWPPKPLRNQ
jgi:hypothetical protein